MKSIVSKILGGEKERKPEPRIETQAPPVRIQAPPIQTPALEKPYDYESDPRFVWPQDKPLPSHVLKIRRAPQPCPRCRRVRFDMLGQCVSCISSGKEFAFFRCKACGHTFKLPVKTF